MSIKTKPTAKTKQAKERRQDATGKEMAALKKENAHLRRRCAKLQKEVERLELLAPELDLEDMDFTEDEGYVSAKKPKRVQCPHCEGLEFGLLEIPGNKIMRVCRSCKWSYVVTHTESKDKDIN